METNNNPTQAFSPEEASQQLDRLESSAEFRERLFRGDIAAEDQRSALIKAAAGTTANGTPADGNQEQPASDDEDTEAPYLREYSAVLADTPPLIQQALSETFYRAGITPEQAQTLRQGHDQLFNYLNGAKPTTEQLSNLFQSAKLTDRQIVEIANGYELATEVQGDTPVRGEVIDNPAETVRHFPDWAETRRLGLIGRAANGITDDQLSRLEQQIGTVAAINKMAHLGRVAEAKSQQRPLTKQADTSASSEIERLINDQDFAKRLLAGEPDATERWVNLQKRTHRGY